MRRKGSARAFLPLLMTDNFAFMRWGLPGACDLLGELFGTVRRMAAAGGGVKKELAADRREPTSSRCA